MDPSAYESHLYSLNSRARFVPLDQNEAKYAEYSTWTLMSIKCHITFSQAYTFIGCKMLK